jgi:hypothetical protein
MQPFADLRYLMDTVLPWDMKMNRVLAKSVFTIGLLLMLMAVPVYGANVNKSVRIDAGANSDGASSVNGSITVGEGATVTGNLKTVNGKIRVSDNATITDAGTVNGSVSIGNGVRAAGLETVNGSISLAEKATADSITAVNGQIALEKGSSVAGNIGNVNGDIALDAGMVGGNVKTVNGDVELSDGARIEGDLIVEKPNSWGFSNNSSMPVITVGPGCVVAGTIHLEREVKLYISETAKVGGVDGAMGIDDAVRFSGDRP